MLGKVYKYSPNGLEEISRINIGDTADAVNKLFDGASKGKEKLIGALIMKALLKEKVKRLGDALSVKGPNEWTVLELQEKLATYRLDQRFLFEEFTTKIRRQR